MKYIPELASLRPKGLFLTVTAIIIASILLGQIAVGRPTILFEETGTIMLASFFLLIGTARANRRIYTLRRSNELPLRRDPALIWAMIGLGFLFLALDETVQIHEQLDHLIHRVFHLRETGWSDRIDDAIIGIYALIGFGLIWLYRVEFRDASALRRWLLIGVVFLVVSVITDALGNRTDVLEAMGLSQDRIVLWHNVIEIIEESCKLYAETCFLLGFLSWMNRLSTEKKAGSA